MKTASPVAKSAAIAGIAVMAKSAIKENINSFRIKIINCYLFAL
jgi:hypothetical protein